MRKTIQTKKSLGQNFLRNKNIIQNIVEAGQIKKDDLVLEVGPGEGTLTQKILEKAGKVIAVEKDERLIPILKEKFEKEISKGRLKIIHEDILNFNPGEFELKANGYKLMANLPYYITGKFLRKLLQEENQPKLMVLMLQKEVAKRIVASDKKESLLSTSVKCYGKPKYIQTVKAREFRPTPKVDSAIILIDQISNPFKDKAEQEKFFSILKTGFAGKRKILKKKLLIFTTKEKIEKVYKECKFDEKSRAENLSLENWRCLFQKI